MVRPLVDDRRLAGKSQRLAQVLRPDQPRVGGKAAGTGHKQLRGRRIRAGVAQAVANRVEIADELGLGRKGQKAGSGGQAVTGWFLHEVLERIIKHQAKKDRQKINCKKDWIESLSSRIGY